MKTFKQIYQLSEQIYDKKKIYYHISPNKFTKFENRQRFRKGDEEAIGGVFLTPRLYMIQQYGYEYLYSHFPDNKEYYVYKCILNRPLNIFNPSSQKDRMAFSKEVAKNPKEFFTKYGSKQFKSLHNNLSKELTDVFTTHAWTSMENPAITKIVRQLGYDGYVSLEHNVGNLMLFNAKDIDIIRWDNKSKTVWKTIDFSRTNNSQIFDDAKMNNIKVDKKNKPDWNKTELEDLRDQRKKYNVSFKNYKSNRYQPYMEEDFDKLGFDEIDSSIFEIRTQTDGPHNSKEVKSYTILPALDHQGRIILSRLEALTGQIKKADAYYFDDEEFDSISRLQQYLINKFDLGDEPDADDGDYTYNPYTDGEIEF